MTVRTITAVVAVVSILMITGVASAGVGHDVGPKTAEALYDVITGELFFDVGDDIAVIGLQSAMIYSGNIDADGLNGAPPVQNDGASLAFFNTTGLPVGEDSVGFMLPAGLALDDIGFSYTPIGLPTVSAPAEFTPEPATMTLLALGGLAMLRRRRNRA
ncbi:MAG: PEP-CTERM sorting domain-containing protein [Phycisphaerae bacterium]|jgi:MYXO-CTERM domain-containing protein|nr:PEP-CTERM sorting domain-containing protein [Phycisphaerae bacterium]